MALRFTSVSLMLTTRPDIGSVAAVTSAVLTTVAEQAEALVRAALADRFTFDGSTRYPLLEGLATDLAIYRLFSRRQYVTLEAKTRSGIDALYTESRSLLAALQAGTLPLVDASGTALAPNAAAQLVHSTTAGYVPTFSELPLEDAGLDPDKLDALAAERDLGAFRDRLL